MISTVPPPAHHRRIRGSLSADVFGVLVAWLAKEEALAAWIETAPNGERWLSFTCTNSRVTLSLGDALVHAGKLAQE